MLTHGPFLATDLLKMMWVWALNVGLMSTIFVLPARGPFLEEKVCISHASGEVLWPVRAMFDVAYGDSNKRQYLQLLDKSAAPIKKVYEEIFKTMPPKLAVTLICD